MKGLSVFGKCHQILERILDGGVVEIWIEIAAAKVRGQAHSIHKTKLSLKKRAILPLELEVLSSECQGFVLFVEGSTRG